MTPTECMTINESAAIKKNLTQMSEICNIRPIKWFFLLGTKLLLRREGTSYIRVGIKVLYFKKDEKDNKNF